MHTLVKIERGRHEWACEEKGASKAIEMKGIKEDIQDYFISILTFAFFSLYLIRLFPLFLFFNSIWWRIKRINPFYISSMEKLLKVNSSHAACVQASNGIMVMGKILFTMYIYINVEFSIAKKKNCAPVNIFFRVDRGKMKSQTSS